MVDFENYNRVAALKRIYLRELEPDLDNILIVGIIIGKQRPRKFLNTNDTQETESFRAVWNFTLRDSPRDYINVSYWGKSDTVCNASDKFYTGDVVEIIRPRVNIRKFNDAGEQFRPMVTSAYALVLNEESQILPHRGDISLMRKLLSIPTKPILGFVPLRDIHNEGYKMKERFVDILGAVRSIGEARNVNMKNGQEAVVREIILFDYTSPGLKVTIWDTDVITRANLWKPRTTILFITDVQINWSDFRRSYSASLTNRSIVTENPIGEEASNLANYAKNAPLESSLILDQFMTTLPDPNTIQNVMCIQQICDKIGFSLQENCMSKTQFTALLFVFVTQLDLDGLSHVVSAKCGQCKEWLKSPSSPCKNLNCSVALEATPGDSNVFFDIRVNLSDHTGTLKNCRLTGSTAEHILNCTIHDFLKMTDDQKSELKWKFLLERCAVRVMIWFEQRRVPLISIVSCTRADPTETAQKVPTC